MIEVGIALFISFLLTVYATPVIIRISKLKKLYDVPNDRKIHKEPIPSLGGLAMFIGIIISLFFTINLATYSEFQYYIVAFVILFFIGLKDDILALSPLKKLLGQMVATIIIVYKCHLLIHNLQGLFGIYELPVAVAHVFTFLVFLFIINAFNLIDGVDGLAGSLVLLTSTILGAYFYINDYTAYAVLAAAVSGAVAGFLFFNIQPAKIFMGDTGSLLLGLCVAIMIIKFIEVAQLSTTAYPVASSPIVALGVIIVPVIDTLRLFVVRFFKRKSPFAPDKNHLHHILLKKGLSHSLVTLTCVFISIIFIIISFLGQHLEPNVLFLGLAVLSLGGIFIIQSARSVYQPAIRVVQGKKNTATDGNDEVINKDDASNAEIQKIAT